jgi:3-oxoacyl-[acyl-carrier protein] reductase
MKLQDAIVVITGASSGIGAATAVKFAEKGAKIVINYRENNSGAHHVLEQVKQLSDGIIVQADVSTPDGVKLLFDGVSKAYSQIDILINNAAIPTDQVPFMDAHYADFKTMLDSDLISVFMCSQAAAQQMLKQGHGKILNTSSIRGWEYGGRAPVYAVLLVPSLRK